MDSRNTQTESLRQGPRADVQNFTEQILHNLRAQFRITGEKDNSRGIAMRETHQFIFFKRHKVPLSFGKNQKVIPIFSIAFS
jgi:hypothetical protein